MIAIFKREVRSYFHNVLGWLFIAAVLAFYGLYFYAYNLRSGYPYVSYSVSAMAFILLIAAPILSMRSLAEERHSKTDQLILTSPISLGKMVMGKYFAMLAVFSIAVLVIALTPLLLSVFGTVPMGESYVAILGFWLYGAACLAIGLFISSLTETQVIAAVGSFAVLFVGYMMSSITGLISESGNWLTAIMGCYDLYTPLSGFMNGCFDLNSFVYYVSLIGLMLFLTSQSIQKRRWSMSSKKIGLSVFSVGTIAIGVAFVVVVNLVVTALPTTITSIDATSNKLYSVTQDTKEYLKLLEKEVELYVLVEEDAADTNVAETLKRYEDMSDCVTVTYVSPASNPLFYQNYTETAPTTNSIIVACGERSRVVDYSDIYEYSYDYYTYSSSIEGYDAEGQITSAIQYVTMDESELPIIYEVEGHGETALSGGFTEAIEKANITLSSLTLLTEEAVPEDAKAIIINGPTTDFSSDDADKIISYIENGGSVILNLSYENQDLKNVAALLEHFGMSVIDGIVMENNMSYYYGGTPYYLLPEVLSSDYTASVAGNYIFAPFGEGIVYGENTDTISYTELLSSSSDAVSKTNVESAMTTALEDGDVAGPFALSVAMEYSADSGETGIMVVNGSVEMFTDAADEVVSGNNASMFTDMISAVTDTSELSVSVIPVKEYTLSAITVDAGTGMLAGVGLMVVIPVIMLGSGVAIWVIRRRK